MMRRMRDEASRPVEGAVQGRLGPGTRLGPVRLRVADLERVSAFYRRGVGLEVVSEGNGVLTLGSRGRPVLELAHTPHLPPPPPGAAGLYHTAVLFEDRADLAGAVYASALKAGGSYVGSADHLVSLAFYLEDPEGNGVELYWDRPRDQWRWQGGQVEMASLPLDPNAFVRDNHRGPGEPEAPVGAAASVGHVHLKVGDVATARAFYVDRLGFDVTADAWPSALFTSAGGYHHHVGMNTWESRGAPRREPALGLESFEVGLTPDDLAAARERLAVDGATVDDEGTVSVMDPWGTVVRLRALPASASVVP